MKAFEKDRTHDNILIPRTPTMIEKDLLVSREHLAFLGSFHNSLDLLPCSLYNTLIVASFYCVR